MNDRVIESVREELRTVDIKSKLSSVLWTDPNIEYEKLKLYHMKAVVNFSQRNALNITSINIKNLKGF